MVRRLALFAGLLFMLAAHASLASENGAPLFALPPLPDADFPGHPTGLTYALIGFPDGSAALQATVRDLSTEVEEPPERLWLIKIDAAGQAGHWMRLPALSAYGAEAALGLGDSSIVLRSGRRGFFYLAKVDRNGILLWEQYLGSGTFGIFPRPVALADGFAVLEDDWRSCRLHRLDENGIERWNVAMPDPIERETDSSFCDPIMVAPRADGGFTVLCNWHNLALERSDGWFFDIDPQGQPRGQRALRAYAETGLALPDGTLAVFGFPDQMPAAPSRPHQGEADTETLMRFDAAEGRMLRSDSGLFPEELEPPWEPASAGKLVALPNGELLVVTEARYDEPSGWFAARIGEQDRVLWLRPLIGDLEGPSVSIDGGTAVLASRQVLFAINNYDEAAGITKAILRVLPLD
jgi:hypothetical protein